MNKQEEYLDQLLHGLGKIAEETEAAEGIPENDLEDVVLDGVSMEEMKNMEINEEEFFQGESSDFEDVDGLVLDSMKTELESGLDVTEFGFEESDFKIDEEDLDFFYDKEDLEADADGISADAESDGLEDDISLQEVSLDELVAERADGPAEMGMTGEETEALEETEGFEGIGEALEGTEEIEGFGEIGEALEGVEGSEEMDEPLESAAEEEEIQESNEPEEAFMEAPQEPAEEADFSADSEEAMSGDIDILGSFAEENSEFEENGSDEGEMDDAQALASVLNALHSEEDNSNEDEFADPEPMELKENLEIQDEMSHQDEEPEEALLDMPGNLGLELEEIVEDEASEEEDSKGKKKKEKKKKDKKKAKRKESLETQAEAGEVEEIDILGEIGEAETDNSTKKAGLMKRLFEDNTEDPPTPEELEAAEAKKAEKQTQKEEKKAQKAEKKQADKEAAAAKKAEKEAEKRRKEEMAEPPEPWKPFTKKVIPMVFLCGVALVVVINILSGLLSYTPYVSNARKYFDARQYEKAYEQLVGLEIKEKDREFYKQVLAMNRFQVKYTSYMSYKENGKKALALHELIQAVKYYDMELEYATSLGLQKEFELVLEKVEAALTNDFGINVARARELASLTTDSEYLEQVKALAP